LLRLYVALAQRKNSCCGITQKRSAIGWSMS
jgi:hypothetical protein